MTDWEDKTNFTQLNGETPGETEKNAKGDKQEDQLECKERLQRL